jgi:Ca2+-binding RTX toxin-like protein
MIFLDAGLLDALEAGPLAKSAFHAGKAAKTAGHHVIYDRQGGALYWDEDGSGAMAQVKLATLDKHLKMHADNILVADFV